jgi:hypothetical protein
MSKAAGLVAVRGAQGADEDAVRPAVDRVGRRVTGPGRYLFRLDDFDDLQILRIGLGIEDVDAGGIDAGNNQVAALGVRVRGIGTETGAAGVPAEVMELVAGLAHIDTTDDLAVAGGARVDVHHAHGVRLPVLLRVNQRHEGVLLRRRLHGHFR